MTISHSPDFKSEKPSFSEFMREAAHKENKNELKELREKVVSLQSQLEAVRLIIEKIKNLQTYQLEDFSYSYEVLRTMEKSNKKVMDKYSDGYVKVDDLREIL